ncbi:MAG TPA: hypothetical protein VF798_06505 [Burkholderiaceae bacterium]
MKYEVWGYSRSARRWIRGVYPTLDFANTRYQYLRRIGRAVKPPQPFGKGISSFYHVLASIDRALFRQKKSPH